MHAEAYEFISQALGWLGDPSGMKVVEFGSHDVNGSPRRLLSKAAKYTGVDPWPGPGVDYTCTAQEFVAGLEYDLCISAETLEHDPDPQGQIEAAWRALRSGGRLILTAASEPRLPHRVDGTEGEMNGEYYGNISPEQLQEWLKDWKWVKVRWHPHGDVYALAVKP